jgi:hypothetical protein
MENQTKKKFILKSFYSWFFFLLIKIFLGGVNIHSVHSDVCKGVHVYVDLDVFMFMSMSMSMFMSM